MAVLINMAASVLIGKRIKYSGNETEAGLLGASCVFLCVPAQKESCFASGVEKVFPARVEVEGRHLY